jgi:hypothetical protein
LWKLSLWLIWVMNKFIVVFSFDFCVHIITYGYKTHFVDHGFGCNSLITAVSNGLFGAVCMRVALLSSWRFPACLNWEIRSKSRDSSHSGIYHSVVGSVISNILKECSTSFFNGQQLPEEGMSGTTCTMRLSYSSRRGSAETIPWEAIFPFQRILVPSQCWELLAQQRSVTCQQTWIYVNTTARSSAVTVTIGFVIRYLFHSVHWKLCAWYYTCLPCAERVWWCWPQWTQWHCVCGRMCLHKLKLNISLHTPWLCN